MGGTYYKMGKYSKEYEKDRNHFKLKFFELKVLDRYKQDPRYKIEESSVSGFLSIKDNYFSNTDTPEEDKIGIQSFGRAFKKKDNSEVIVTYLPYLADLSEKHQSHWESHEVNEKCILDKDFFNQEFNAEFVDRVSVFDAFIQELVEINKLCSLMEEPNLFRNSFENKKPIDFIWITKPTYKEYHQLVHLIDKLISDNINKDFFKEKLELNEIKPQKDGTLIKNPKSTIRLLEEYFNRFFRFPDPKPKDETISIFKNIRKERIKPAHKIEDNTYNKAYFKLQKDLVYNSYKAIRCIRLMLTNHPRVKDYKPPEWLQKGRII